MSHKFDEWFRENAIYSESYDDARVAWMEAIHSLKVTRYLARMAVSVFQDRPATEDDVSSMEVALTVVLNALKEQEK